MKMILKCDYCLSEHKISEVKVLGHKGKFRCKNCKALTRFDFLVNSIEIPKETERIPTDNLDPDHTATLPLDEKLKASFKRGNINFDFLQPEKSSDASNEDHTPEKRNRNRQGKRGIFNRGRPIQKINKNDIILWLMVNLFSLAGLISLFMIQNLFLMIILPIIFSAFLWSSIMLSLFFARPR